MDKYTNIIKEVSEEYKNKGIQDIIFQPDNNDLFKIYGQILVEDLKPGNMIKIRFDWCKEDKFKVVHINVETAQEELFKNVDAGKEYIEKESMLLVKDDSLQDFIKLFDKSYNFKGDNSRSINNKAENSVLDIHLILDNENNLHVVRYEILRATGDSSIQNNDCSNADFLVYDHKEAEAREKEEAEARAQKEAEARANAASENTSENVDSVINDEPDSDSESISGESSTPLDKKMHTRQDESEKVAKIAEGILKNPVYKKEEDPAIIKQIDETISELRKFKARNMNEANQFEHFNKRYEGMIDFINNYLSDDTFYANDINIHKFKSINQNNYYKFKNEWENIKSKLEKQYNLLTVNTSDYWFTFEKKVFGFIELLTALRNDINVNLFRGRTIRGGRKTKRRLRKIFSKNKRTKRHRNTSNL